MLLGSLELFAFRVGTFHKLNEALSDYGPENCRGFQRVTVKERKGQQTCIERQNIHVPSFSGTAIILYFVDNQYLLFKIYKKRSQLTKFVVKGPLSAPKVDSHA